MQLDITPAEAQVLEEVLARALGDLREEIYKSEVTDYKAALKQREVIIQSLLQQLRARSPT
jgi:hypothetical protein